MESRQTIAVIVFGFGILFVVLWREGVERPVVSCVFDGSQMFAAGVPVNMERARAGHQFAGYIVD
ncbi:hypothetical protein ACFFQF_23020 [Haladaptatus pallidirubidus]|uniref:hypothetical protein n=1 Tax=Haladaptatus pallidirubidus TaxID=1008152 RepID=UPI0035EB9F5E